MARCTTKSRNSWHSISIACSLFIPLALEQNATISNSCSGVRVTSSVEWFIIASKTFEQYTAMDKIQELFQQIEQWGYTLKLTSNGHWTASILTGNRCEARATGNTPLQAIEGAILILEPTLIEWELSTGIPRSQRAKSL